MSPFPSRSSDRVAADSEAGMPLQGAAFAGATGTLAPQAAGGAPAAHSLPTGWRWTLAVLLGCAFFGIEQQWDISTFEFFQLPEDFSQPPVIWRRLGFGTLAALTAALALLPPRQRGKRSDVVGWLIMAGLAWCGLSICWSVEPASTARRVILLYTLAALMVTLARQVSLEDLVTIVMIVASISVGLGLVAELSQATLRPGAAGYRFAGAVHPNTQGAYCALLCLAAVIRATVPGAPVPRTGDSANSPARVRIGYGILGGLAFVLLLLTRSRTSLLGLALGLAVVWYLSATVRRRWAAGLVLPLILAGVLLTLVIAGWRLEELAVRAFMLGRSEEAPLRTLNGRLPLWQYLATRAAERPATGFGYGAFWTADHTQEVTEEVGWRAFSAHSSYLELMLGVGLPGLVLALGVLAAGLPRIWRECRRSPQAGQLFVLGAVAFAMVAASLESLYAMPPSGEVVLVATGFMILVWYESPRPGPPESEIRPGPADVPQEVLCG